jgi:hypothetical protein
VVVLLDDFYKLVNNISKLKLKLNELYFDDVKEKLLYAFSLAFGVTSYEYNLAKSVYFEYSKIEDLIKKMIYFKTIEKDGVIYILELTENDLIMYSNMLESIKINSKKILDISNSLTIFDIFKMKENEVKYVTNNIVFVAIKFENGNIKNKIIKLERIQGNKIYYTEYYYIPTTSHISDFTYEEDGKHIEYLKSILPKEVLLDFFNDEELI